MSPTATEMLFAIGAGDQVVAADSYSNYPADAPTTELSAYEPNVEAIAAYEPDLVVYATTSATSKSLDKLHIPALAAAAAAATLDDVYAQLEQLGKATGHAAEAPAQVDDLQAEVADVSRRSATRAGMTYYYELDDTYYSVTSDTFIGNCARPARHEEHRRRGEGREPGYPQLSAEYIVRRTPT